MHRSYLPEIRDLRARVEIKGLAHITGGGLLENIPRILPAGAAVEIDASKWEAPPLFRFLKERGGVDWMEMHRVFNMGIGMVVIVSRRRGRGGRARRVPLGSVSRSAAWSRGRRRSPRDLPVLSREGGS